MARTVAPSRDRTVYECVEPFSPAGPGRKVYGFGDQVVAGDPILDSHPAHFVLAADRIERAVPGIRHTTPAMPAVEAMTAAPGEVRPVVLPDPNPETPTTKESTDAQD